MIVYRATNRINGHFYIGATKRELEKRRYEHRRAAVTESTTNGRRSCRAFNAAIRKHGWEAFDWDVLAECADVDELMAEEARCIHTLKPYYNILAGGYGLAIRSLDGQAEICLLQKPVRCVDDGVVYKSITDAAASYGSHVSLVSAAIYRGGRSKGRKFEFVNESHGDGHVSLQPRKMRGVMLRKDIKDRPWVARVWCGGKIFTVGRFSTPEEAHAAHVEAVGRLGVHDLPKKNNKSGVRGVCERNGRFHASLRLEGSRRFLGSYATLDEARSAISTARADGVHGVMANAASRPKMGTMPYRGVELCGRRWRARHRKTSLGMFDTPEEAHAAYLTAKAAP